MALTLKDTLAQLESLRDEKVYAQNRKRGAGDNQFGVRLGDIRKLAEKIKSNHELALALWDTGNIDAQHLAILLLKPNKLSRDEMDRMVRSVTFAQVADWLNSYVVKNHPDKEALRQVWMDDADPWAARAGWSLTAGRVARSADGLDLPGLLDRIESEMGNAAPEVQWTMNSCLAVIGIHFPEHRERALTIGEKLGVYRDYPVSKGCTSPFARSGSTKWCAGRARDRKRGGPFPAGFGVPKFQVASAQLPVNLGSSRRRSRVESEWAITQARRRVGASPSVVPERVMVTTWGVSTVTAERTVLVLSMSGGLES